MTSDEEVAAARAAWIEDVRRLAHEAEEEAEDRRHRRAVRGLWLLFGVGVALLVVGATLLTWGTP